MEPNLAEHNSSNLELDAYSYNILEFFEANRDLEVGKAITDLSNRLSIERHEIIKRIYLLKDKGLIEVYDVQPPTNLHSFLISLYSLWFWTVAALVVPTIFLAYLALAPPLIYARYLFGLLFMLYLPGASLIELFYPDNKKISQLEKVALSVGISLTLDPLLALVLNFSPWGIRFESILAFMTLMTICLAMGATVNKYRRLKLGSYN